MFETFGGQPQPARPESALEKMEDAENAVDEMFEKGIHPIITVPRKYLEVFKNGLRAHSTWIHGDETIAGTMGREPYLPRGEKEPRVIVEISGIARGRIHPRLTGPNVDFNGVVTLDGPIPPEAMHIQVDEAQA